MEFCIASEGCAQLVLTAFSMDNFVVRECTGTLIKAKKYDLKICSKMRLVNTKGSQCPLANQICPCVDFVLY